MPARRALLAFAASASLCACGPAPMPDPAAGSAPPQDAMAPADVAAAAVPAPGLMPAEPVANDLGSAVVDRWVGTWTGPEGTSLKLAKQEVGYQVLITDLDGQREFHGVAAGELLQFERDGVTETVHASDGEATGMKWLADKRDCLTVKTGEGYCRD